MSEDKPVNNNFKLIEAVLLVIFVAAIGAVYAYIVHERNTPSNLLSSSSQNYTAPPGTTASIEQITLQDGANEADIEDSHDAAYAQSATSSNSAVIKVGNAYNETNY
jgi:hypothetical protein